MTVHIGDRVKIKSDFDYYSNGRYAGEMGTVLELSPYGWDLKLKMDSDEEGYWECFNFDDLEEQK